MQVLKQDEVNFFCCDFEHIFGNGLYKSDPKLNLNNNYMVNF